MFDLQPLYVLGREESLIGNNKTSLIGPESILTNVGIVRVDENSDIHDSFSSYGTLAKITWNPQA